MPSFFGNDTVHICLLLNNLRNNKVLQIANFKLAISNRQVHAVTPPRKNTKPWKDSRINSIECKALHEIIRGQINRKEFF